MFSRVPEGAGAPAAEAGALATEVKEEEADEEQWVPPRVTLCPHACNLTVFVFTVDLGCEVGSRI